ncbi:MAG TPA: hypothetical protein RMG48_00890 [Myxococcales bacterium LLY-WYZ-16_1]|nr:hypothetical protein [Myxococcales bacterium LLY-WYZ-16_1]
MDAHTGSAVRCANCGAPLKGVARSSVVICPYCETENHVAETPEGIRGLVARMKQASHEADAIAAANEEKAEELMQRFLAELGNFEQGDSRAADRALCAYEGYLRLQFAPTLHMYAAMGHDHPAAAEGMRSIDEAVATALRSVVENHGLPTPTDK